jgi:hypothetical protein
MQWTRPVVEIAALVLQAVAPDLDDVQPILSALLEVEPPVGTQPLATRELMEAAMVALFTREVRVEVSKCYPFRYAL